MSQNSEQFYNRFSFFYPMVDWFLQPQKERLFHEINLLPKGNLLEIGIGNGSHLAKYKNHQITGIDTSKGMLNIAEKRKKPGTKLLLMTGECLDFKNAQFDYVVLSHVLAVVDDPDKVLEECSRVLKPNGKLFILNHFTPNNALKYVDFTFNYFSKFLYFKSSFHLSQFSKLNEFELEKEINFVFSYFKLIVYRKS